MAGKRSAGEKIHCGSSDTPENQQIVRKHTQRQQVPIDFRYVSVFVVAHFFFFRSITNVVI